MSRRFTTRVELYGDPSYETYKSLHAEMESKGFSRQIKFDKITYWLPNAEYTISKSDATQHQIKDLAVEAASKVWKDFGVLVTQTEVDRGYYNLKKA